VRKYICDICNADMGAEDRSRIEFDMKKLDVCKECKMALGQTLSMIPVKGFKEDLQIAFNRVFPGK